MAFWKRLFGENGDPDDPRDTRGPSSDPPMPAFSFPLEACRGMYVSSQLPMLRKKSAERGTTLVLIGDEEDALGLHEQQEINLATPDEYLNEASRVDVDQWLRKRVELDPETYECEPGDWPSAPVQPMSLVAHLDMATGKPKQRVYCATLPTPRSWEAPAYLKYGNWNDCPDAHFHVAMAKRWHKQFGAEIIAFTRDTIEFEVARPPIDRDSSMRLAREQFIYCSDIVHQGLDNLEMLAATLQNGRHWYFWWD